MTAHIYKVLEASAWHQAKAAERFERAEIDRIDGYIHFSSAAQLGETLAKHFHGRAGLVLLGVAPQKLRATLKWEVSRGGDRFPHLYGELNLDAVESAEELTLGEDGVHVLPDHLQNQHGEP